MSSWRIRLAQQGDADAMSLVEDDAARLFATEPSLQGLALPTARTPKVYREIISQGRCLVAMDGDEMIGFAACRAFSREIHLHELSVREASQGKGVGRRLLYAVEADARASGYCALTLNTFRDVAWNAPFYARHGFVEVEDLASHPRLKAAMDAAVDAGLPRERRCAMIKSFE